MRQPTNEEITHFKSLAQDDMTADDYYSNMIPIILEHVNGHIKTEAFADEDYLALPGAVRLFISQVVKYFSNAEFGLKSESVRSASFTYDYSKLPEAITGLLTEYGYSTSKRISFISAW